MKTYKNLALFVLGTLFGSAGFSALKTRDAKKIYVELAALGLRAKDSAMDTVTALREETGDILSEARELNASRAAALTPEIVEDSADKE